MEALKRETVIPAIVIAFIVLAFGLTTYSSIYPDEVAYKIFLERYFISGGFKQSVTPFCEDAFLVKPALPLLPAAAIWSLISKLGYSWLSYRILPYLGLLTIYAVLIATNLRKGITSFWPLLLLLTLGPAIYGIALLRAEVLILSLCMLIYMLGESMMRPSKAWVLYVKASFILLLFSLCVYVHPKALYIVAPVSGAIVFSAGSLAHRPQKIIYTAIFLVLTFFVTQAAMNLHFKQFLQCHSSPAIEKTVQTALGKQAVNPLDSVQNSKRFDEDMSLAFGQNAFEKTIERMTYQPNYQAKFLPEILAPDDWDIYANLLIEGTVLCFIVYIIAKVFACLIFLKGTEERKRFYLVLLVCGSLLVPFLLNITKHFYEVSFLICVLMIISGLLWSFRLRHYGKYSTYIALAFNGAMITISALCLFVSSRDFTPAFEAGYEGDGLSYQTERRQLGKAIRDALFKASVSKHTPLIVDDLTYDAVKFHKVVIPVTYLLITQNTKGAIAHYALKYQASYGVISCYYLNSLSANNITFEILATISHVRSSGKIKGVDDNICVFRLKSGSE